MSTTRDMARLYATYDGILTNHELDRLIHLIEVGHGALLHDVETFTKAAEKNPEQARSMTMMAEQFQQYVDEGVELATKLRSSRDAHLQVAIVGYDPAEVTESMARVAETLAEPKEAS